MDMNNLQAFIEVAEKKSFSRSAESLNLTQPAVSKRIAALESELASKLFDRVGRSVHLTEAGRVLLPSALKIHSEVSRIETEISTLGKEVAGKLSIGTAEHVGLDRLAPVLKLYKEKYSDVEIDMFFLNSTEVLDGVERGTLDMGLCAGDGVVSVDKSHTHLKNIEIWSDQLKIVASKDHPLAGGGQLAIEQLARFSAILPKQRSSARKSIDKVLAKHGVEAKVSMEAADFTSIKSMAAIGIGWACLPASEFDDSLTLLPVQDFDICHSVSLVRNSDRSLSRSAQAFLDTLPALLM